MYKVKTDSFSGPLDLLLTLIEKRKLFIGDVALAEVADNYIAYTQTLSSLPIKDTAHFLLVASTLVLIKSKSLLPTIELTKEEEGSIEELEMRLKLYKRMREIGNRHITTQFGKHMIFRGGSCKIIETVFSPDEHTNTQSIIGAIRSVLGNLPKKEIIPEIIVKKIISLEEMIENLTKRITENLKMSFHEFSGKRGQGKADLVVGFLAMLELVKQGIIGVNQDKQFGDIVMESQEVDTPKY